VYVKIFQQIFDSSIADNAKLRRMFMDMLVLADLDGVVDMTHEAISRRIGVPLDEVMWAIGELMKPDPADRSGKKNGARLVFIDPGRDWGWRIVNYHHYRGLRDDESRRAYRRQWMRDYRRRKRQNELRHQVNFVKKKHHSTRPCTTEYHSRDVCEQPRVTAPDSSSEKREQHVNSVNTRDQVCTYAEGETDEHVPPTVPQRGDKTDDFVAKTEWLNKLFCRKRDWSYEETQLLAALLPISREDRALLSWAYTLPRDSKGWALIDGVRASKPKQSLVALLREFSSEIDKWRSVRRNDHAKDNSEKKEPQRWREFYQWKYGKEIVLPTSFWQLSGSKRDEYEHDFLTFEQTTKT
jgi:hypothetical protein